MSDPSTSSPIHVIKIGGSLLGEPGGMSAVADWLAAKNDGAAHRVLIAGGGAVVDGLRRIDEANDLPALATHWAAIAAMDANTRLLAEAFPGAQPTRSLERIRRSASGRSRDWRLLVGEFLRREEPGLPGRQLGVGWDVTSDSIAARVAVCLRASLTLLKAASVGLTPYRHPGDLAAAAVAGLVDPAFERVARDLCDVRIEFALSRGVARKN